MKNLQLENLKIGDEVVTFSAKNHEYGCILKIKEWSEGHNGFVLVSQLGKTHGILPKDGKGYYAMHHSREKPHFYYSANPKHLKAAKKKHERAKILREKKEAILEQKRKLISPILESYTDSEEGYRFDFLSTDDLLRLSTKQIEMLVSWLK